MNSLKVIFQRYKTPLIFLAIALFGIWIFNTILFPAFFEPATFDDQNPDETPLTPGDTGIDPNQNIKRLKFVSATPRSGRRESIDNMESFKLSFSAPVDPKTVNITVDPSIELKAVVFDSDLNSLVISPAGSGWENDIRYNITLDVRGFSGEILARPVEYVYLNIFPENIPYPQVY